ncbi:MAG: hypothetical protein ACI9GB_000453, partial [Halioglobus sp.]
GGFAIFTLNFYIAVKLKKHELISKCAKNSPVNCAKVPFLDDTKEVVTHPLAVQGDCRASPNAL